ncbi:MAG: hypothetical protein AB8G22_28635 [Saprospiraceae bacterium]
MQTKLLITLLLTLLVSTFSLQAQYTDLETTNKKCFIGSTAFVILGQFAQTNQPDFAQLNFGYRLTTKDVVSIEFKTWKYAWPIGIPYGEFFEAAGENFPGHIREFGVAFVYQRYWWKGLYTGVHVMNAFQSFVNEEGNKIDNGFQLFNTYRLGYHVKLFNNRFFIEPSIAVTHRPLQTEMPDDFQIVNDKWSKFFFGEPGLHFGFNF